MKAINGIKNSIKNQEQSIIIARKIFLSYSTEIFKEDEDREFYIKNSISTTFNVPFSSIEVAGSGKAGLSFFKDRIFIPGESDLDIAVISLPLFDKLSQQAHFLSKGYSDLTVFPLYHNQRTDKQFKKGITNGYINPFYMPNCSLKSQWLNFFNKLSNSHIDLFKNINGGVYASEYYFESKQEECIDNYIANPVKYNEISGSV